MIIVNPTAALTKAIVAGSKNRPTKRSVRRRVVRRQFLGDTPVTTTSLVPTSPSTPVTPVVPSSGAVAAMSQEQWQAAMLQNAQTQYAYLQTIWKKATMQRYIATAATVAIPVFATIWKWFLKRRAA